MTGRHGRSVAHTCRSLIVNADDFGLCADVTAGIVAAHRAGLVRSASLLVTAPDALGAIAAARAHPRLDLGLHLALTTVAPALPPDALPSLLTAAGRFPDLGPWLRRMARRTLNPDDLERELRAQIERALATGLTFSHLDSHHHVHLWPPVAPIVARLAREYDLPWVRRIGRQPTSLTPLALGAKRLLLSVADGRAARDLAGLSHVEAFRGLPFPTTLASWTQLARSLPHGCTELMCHPGVANPLLGQSHALVAARDAELRWLCDPRVAALLAQEDVTLTSFAEQRATRHAGSAGNRGPQSASTAAQGAHSRCPLPPR